MKKKQGIIVLFGVILFVTLIVFFQIQNYRHFSTKVVSYDGNNLRISIDGIGSSTLPTSGNYYLVDYDCKSANTVVDWDRNNFKLKVSNKNKKGGVSCYLDFQSNPKLSDMKVGSYVSYTGSGGTVGSTNVSCQTNGKASSSTETTETEAPNSCNGQNAREDLDTTGYTYGYCYSANYKYYVTGWRIAYIDSNNKPVIVSAGSPECNTRASSTANVTYIKTANTKALKYCNTSFVDGDCTCTDNDGDGVCDTASTDAWGINDTDFYNITKAISGVGKRLTGDSSTLGDNGGSLGTTLYCYEQYSKQECGYNNDLIDNGGFYWFAARYTSSSGFGVYWNSYNRHVYGFSYTNANGLRPVISLSSSVIVTGGSGTMDDPYTIGNNTFLINGGATTVSNTARSGITLSLMTANATQMCISTNTSVCTDYIPYADTYTLDWSNESAGEKIVYVYYKDSTGRVVATMKRSVTLSAT